MKLVLDIETNKLRNPDVIHCAVTKNLETGEVNEFTENNAGKLQQLLNSAELIIGHNIIEFDLTHLARLWGISVHKSRVCDTLVVSRILNYNMVGGHSLDAWGQRLNFPKLPFKEFTTYTKEMLKYCINDVELNARLYKYLLKWINRDEFKRAIEVEHQIAFLCQDLHTGGFPFDYDKALKLKEELEKEVAELDKEIVQTVPLRAVSMGVVTPKLTKFGTISRSNMRWYSDPDYSVFTAGAPFTRVVWEEFNPGSVKQIVQYLTDSNSWSPVDRTDGYIEAVKTKNKAKVQKLEKYGWKVNEVNLATLKEHAPEALRKLVQRLALASRISTLNQWIKAYNPNSGSIHATFNGIGTWTHRMSHKEPNLANVAAEKSIKYKESKLAEKVTQLGGAMRSLFHAPRDAYLVGTDAEGIQLRIFGHYVNDDKLIEAIVNGNKELKTDIHSLNLHALGSVCRDRDSAKTFIYAFLLGAGVGKVGAILNCGKREAEQAIQNFLAAYPGLDELKRLIIPRDAKRGYFQGLDGRLVTCRSEHLMLAGYLQNGEATIMKHAMVEWVRELDKLGILYQPCNFVHDEWQTIVYGDKKAAEKVGEVQRDAIRNTGLALGVRCPLAGSSAIGFNWHDTH